MTPPRSPSPPSKRKRPLSSEEKGLWQIVVRGVKRLIHQEESGPPIEPTQKIRDTPKKFSAPPPQHTPQPSSSLSPSLPTRHSVIKRRKFKLEGRIDLHGLSRDNAYTKLCSFLENSRAQGKTWVLVITGKGTPQRPSIIRQSVPDWLDANPLRSLIAEYTVAKQSDGGIGALYVRLKKR